MSAPVSAGETHAQATQPETPGQGPAVRPHPERIARECFLSVVYVTGLKKLQDMKLLSCWHFSYFAVSDRLRQG